jgi:hypothetical protein
MPWGCSACSRCAAALRAAARTSSIRKLNRIRSSGTSIQAQTFRHRSRAARSDPSYPAGTKALGSTGLRRSGSTPNRSISQSSESSIHCSGPPGSRTFGP